MRLCGRFRDYVRKYDFLQHSTFTATCQRLVSARTAFKDDGIDGHEKGADL